MVRERSVCVEGSPRGVAGAIRGENAGMSSENKVRIFIPEYPRFPWPRSSTMGEATLRPGHIKYGVADGLPVNIPVLV